MNKLFKDNVFYILIVDNNSGDHLLLRKGLAKILPQAIIESIYDENETINYIEHFNIPPNIILLSMSIEHIFLRMVIGLIRKKQETKDVPIIMLNANKNINHMEELKQLGANEFYTKTSKGLELKVLLRDIKRRLLPPTGKLI